jgi:hypothetical protein
VQPQPQQQQQQWQQSDVCRRGEAAEATGARQQPGIKQQQQQRQWGSDQQQQRGWKRDQPDSAVERPYSAKRVH